MPRNERETRRPPAHQISIELCGTVVEVPPCATLLHCFEHLHPETVSSGNYCGTGECAHCETSYMPPDGGRERTILACLAPVVPGMKVTTLSLYLQKDLGLVTTRP